MKSLTDFPDTQMVRTQKIWYQIEIRLAETPLPIRFWSVAVYVEVSYRELYVGQRLDDEVDALLTAAGFEPAGRFNACEVDGRPVQADLLYLRAGSAAEDG